GAVEVATWETDGPWQSSSGQRTLHTADLRPDDWGVWLNRDELLILLRRVGPGTREPAEITRLRAILGRLSGDRPVSNHDLEAARRVLPEPAFAIEAASVEAASEALARANEAWAPEAAWAGLTFQFLPLSSLP